MTTTTNSDLPRPWPTGLLFGALATAANLIVFGIARLATGDDITVPGWNGNPPQTVGPVPIIFATMIPALLAIGFGQLLGRFLAKPKPVFVGLVGAVTLLSTSGPLSSGAPAGTVVALVAMHLLTGAVIGYGVARTLPSRARATQAATG